MKKILHIPNYYKPHIGGIEQTCHDIVEACVGKFEQKVICFSADKNTIVEMIDGVEVTKCGVWKKILSQSISFSYKKKLKEIIKNFKPDIIIFHYPNPFVAHYLKKHLKNKNIEFVLWYHADIIKQKIIRKFFEGQTKKLLKRANKVACTSPIYRDTSKNLLKVPNKVTVIPSCINEERLVLSKEDEELAKTLKQKYLNKKLVFAFGRHVKYKGLTYLVEASKYLDESYQIIIGGTGPLTNDLKQQAADDSKIEFIGRITDNELRAYLKIMDIYAFPSITKNEAFGLSLAEGMYFNHPAVTFTIEGSGVNYVSLNNVTGIEVENSNAKKFAEAINVLGSDSILCKKMGDKAGQRVREMFLFEQFKLLVINLLEEK